MLIKAAKNVSRMFFSTWQESELTAHLLWQEPTSNAAARGNVLSTVVPTTTSRPSLLELLD